MKFTTAIFFATALIAGVAIGYMFNPSVVEPTPAEESEIAKGAIKDNGDAATIAALRARIAELEAKLSKRGRDAQRPGDEERIAENGEGEGRGPRGYQKMSRKERREKMMKEHPEHYARMTNTLARMHAERRARVQKKLEFLSSLDVSKMSESARKTHSDLQELIAKREEIAQKMHELFEREDEPTKEEIDSVHGEMREIDQEFRELNKQERDNLMLEVSKNLGFNEEDSSLVTAAFQEIMENTEGGRGPHGNGGPGGSGGNPPPPPGN